VEDVGADDLHDDRTADLLGNIERVDGRVDHLAGHLDEPAAVLDALQIADDHSVASSSPHVATKSVSSRTVLLPSDTTSLNPTPFSAAQSRTAVTKAPD